MQASSTTVNSLLLREKFMKIKNQIPAQGHVSKIVLVTAFTLAACFNSVRADISTGLLLRLALDETNGTTAVDATGNGHNATLFNFPVDDSQWTTGRISGGLRCNTDFTGLQYTTIDDSTNGLNFAINPNPAFTLAAWVRGKVSSAQTNGSGIIARGYGRGGEQYAIDTFGSSFRFFVRDAAGAGGFTIQQPAGPTNVADGSWQHVVGVFDSTLSTNRLKLYINGQLIGQTNGPTTLFNLAHDVSIGSREDNISSGYNLPFTGIMDEVRIYNRALVPSDVQELYLAAGLAAPSIVVQPQSISRFVSENATFSVAADGTFPLRYQWRKDGVNIPNATNSTLTITPLVLTNAGTYAVMVSNSVNFVVSSNAVLTVTQLATDDFSTGLIAWWKFDETSGNVAVDSSGNANNATLYQFPSDGSQWKTNGRLGGSLRFNVTGGDDGGDKNDYVWTDAPIPFPYNSNTFSFTFWMKVVGTEHGANPRMITPANGLATGNLPVWEIWRRTGASGGLAGVGPNNPRTSETPDFVWKHFGIVHDITAGSYTLYVNGVFATNSATTFTRANPSAFRWAIGHSENLTATGDVDFFRGELDDFRMYNRILSASQVAALYSAAGSRYGFDLQPLGANKVIRDTFAVTARAGTTTPVPISYQWIHEGTNIPGATNISFTIPAIDLSDVGNYALVANSSAGIITSSNALLAVSTNLPLADLTNALTAYYTYNETNGTVAADSSGNNYTANLLNFPTDNSQWVTGVVGGALRFGAVGMSNLVVSADGFSFGDPDNFSFSFWAKRDPGAQGTNPRFISPAGKDWIVWRPTETAGANPAGVGLYMPATSAQPASNTWIHFACAMDRLSNKYSLYVNGIRTVDKAIPVTGPLVGVNGGTVSAVKAVPTTFLQWVVGHSEILTNHSESFRGSLDDVRIYNRQLNINDIESLYVLGNPSPVLSVKISGATATLTWNSWALGFILESTDTIGGTWTNAGGSPTLSGYSFSQSVSLVGGAKFYRLRKP